MPLPGESCVPRSAFCEGAARVFSGHAKTETPIFLNQGIYLKSYSGSYYNFMVNLIRVPSIIFKVYSLVKEFWSLWEDTALSLERLSRPISVYEPRKHVASSRNSRVPIWVPGIARRP